MTKLQSGGIVKATILGELGVGPRALAWWRSTVEPGLVMEAVAGDFPEAMRQGQPGGSGSGDGGSADS